MSDEPTPAPIPGPEIVGMRINVYHLFYEFLNPNTTEADVCRWYNLTPQQVATGRAYILHNYEAVRAVHEKCEAERRQPPTPEVMEAHRRAHASFALFREWFEERKEFIATSTDGDFPTYEEWKAAHNRIEEPVAGAVG